MKHEIKIAVFTDTFDELNGVAVTYQRFLKYAEDNDLQLDVYTQVKEKETVENYGTARLLRFKPAFGWNFYSDLVFDFILPNPRIYKRFKEEKYDIIDSAAVGSMGINALLISRIFGIPLVGSHNTDIPRYIMPHVRSRLKFLGPKLSEKIGLRLEKATRRYFTWYYRNCDYVVTPSLFNKLELDDILGRKVGIFSRGVDADIFSPDKRDNSLLDEHRRILTLYVGRISLEKNLDILVKIFRERDNVTLICVGDGPYKSEMQRRLPNAFFTGPIYDRAELARIYASADFFVFPSTTETFGQVITEAASSGLPVIVSYAGASKEQVTHGIDGFVAHDIVEFGHFTDVLVNDGGLRQLMGVEARKSALKRTWNIVFDNLLCTYEKVISEYKNLPNFGEEKSIRYQRPQENK